MVDTSHIPSSYELRDELLVFATLRQKCEMSIAEPEVQVERKPGIIVDVYSGQGAKYLEVDDGSLFHLDQLQALNDEPVA